MTAAAKMDSMYVSLEARSPAHRCHRAYEIAVSQDLFGAWLVQMSYGRIGTRGRTKVRSFPTDIEVAAQVRTCLRKQLARRSGLAWRTGSGERSMARRGINRSSTSNYAAGFPRPRHRSKYDLT
jgi:predicted DNA-binding WGR domain protein